MRVFTTQVTGCGNCPYRYNDEWHGHMCQHDSTFDIDSDKCLRLYYENLASITESCPMYSQTTELPC